jgi:hypothetical protein
MLLRDWHTIQLRNKQRKQSQLQVYDETADVPTVGLRVFQSKSQDVSHLHAATVFLQPSQRLSQQLHHALVLPHLLCAGKRDFGFGASGVSFLLAASSCCMVASCACTVLPSCWTSIRMTKGCRSLRQASVHQRGSRCAV